MNFKKKKYNILCVIQARSGSKGIKKKNIKQVSGHPLLAYSIYAAKKSKLISKLVVSTDSNEIKNVSLNYGAEVPFLRPKKLSTDKIWSRDSLKHAVLKTEEIFNEKYDFIIELPAVAPLRTSKSVDLALKKLIKTKSDSVIGVTRVYDRHPLRIKKIKNDLIYDFYERYKEGESSRRQDLKAAYVRNGSIYAMKRDTIVKNFSRTGKISRPYIMDAIESVNIDEITDFYNAEKIIQMGLCKNKPADILLNNKIKYERNSNNKKTILVSYPDYMFKLVNLPQIKKYNYIFCDIKNIKKIDNKYFKNIVAWLVPTNGLTQISEKIIKLLPSLKYLLSPATGQTHLNLQEISRRKIRLIYLEKLKDTKNIYASSEYCLLLILATIRKIKNAIQIVDQGDWRNYEKFLRGNEISNYNFGIFGFGRIGKNIYKYLSAMNAKCHYFDPYVKTAQKIKKYSNIKEFLKNTNCLIISAKLNKNNFGFFNFKKLKLLKKNSTIVNIARGELIVERDLIKLIKRKHITSYGADVVSQEEKILKGGSKLINYSRVNKNVLISPHIGGLTYQSEQKAITNVLKKLFKEL